MPALGQSPEKIRPPSPGNAGPRLERYHVAGEARLELGLGKELSQHLPGREAAAYLSVGISRCVDMV